MSQTEPQFPIANEAPPTFANQPARARALTRLNSCELFGGAMELLIEHHDAVYRLRKTRGGKLILTK